MFWKFLNWTNKTICDSFCENVSKVHRVLLKINSRKKACSEVNFPNKLFSLNTKKSSHTLYNEFWNMVSFLCNNNSSTNSKVHAAFSAKREVDFVRVTIWNLSYFLLSTVQPWRRYCLGEIRTVDPGGFPVLLFPFVFSWTQLKIVVNQRWIIYLQLLAFNGKSLKHYSCSRTNCYANITISQSNRNKKGG